MKVIPKRPKYIIRGADRPLLHCFVVINQLMNCLLTHNRKQDPEPVDPFPDSVVPVEPVDLEDDLTISLPTALRSNGR